MTTDTTPLPIAVELAREMVDDYISDQHEQIIAGMISDRIRPLVDFARAVESNIDYAEEHGHPTVFAGFPELREKLDAALRAAGAE